MALFKKKPKSKQRPNQPGQLPIAHGQLAMFAGYRGTTGNFIGIGRPNKIGKLFSFAQLDTYKDREGNIRSKATYIGDRNKYNAKGGLKGLFAK